MAAGHENRKEAPAELLPTPLYRPSRSWMRGRGQDQDCARYPQNRVSRVATSALEASA